MPSKRAPVPKQKAVIGWLDNEESSTTSGIVPSGILSAGEEVVERIKKCFERADHVNANENEARAAIMMASKYMKQHNIQRADLLEHENQSTRAARGGMSNVNIWPAKNDMAVRNQTWVNDLICAMEKFFDCTSYSTDLGDNIEWTFYGIAEHTISAAIAFEMCHNLIQEWSGPYTSVAARNSYSLGVADGLCRLAEQEKIDTEKAARDSERKAFAARLKDEDLKAARELERLRDPPPAPTSTPTPPASSPEKAAEPADYIDYDMDGFDDDGSSDNEAMPDFNDQTAATVLDTAADFDTEMSQFILPEHDPEPIETRVERRCGPHPPRAKSLMQPEQAGLDQEETAEWSSTKQLSTYRNYAKEIEDSVLKEKGIKLVKGRRAKRCVKDRDVFRIGRKDAEKINVKAARIGEGKDAGDVQESEVSSTVVLP